MRAAPPVCKTVQPWLKHHCGKHCFAPLTGQDFEALQAFVHLVRLYGYSDTDGRRAAIVAMSAAVEAMQPKTRYLAKRSIPHMLDWSHEAEIWGQIERRTAGKLEVVR